MLCKINDVNDQICFGEDNCSVTSDTLKMEDTKTKTVIFTNYKSNEDLKIGTREIKTVEFHKSKLDKIPAKLLDHQELQNVIFNGCKFTHVDNLEQLKICKNLVKLTLEECNLQTYPDFLSEFDTLDTLNMSGNSFKEGLPDSMTKLINLERLDISRCMLQEFPLVLNKVRTLKMLNIEGNVGISSLSESLENLTNLESLHVSKCSLTEFPQVLGRLKSLQKLDIRWNDRIQKLPGILENLTNIETLDVSRCGLTEFPHVLCKLESLKALYIGENDKIQNLPFALESLTNLEILCLFSCDLTEFPQVLCKLKSLQNLNIGLNEKIHNIPNTLEDLTNLETLNLSKCGLKEFPEVLSKLKLLKNLNIGWNKFQNLPDTLENLTNLETLDVSKCGLTEFPQVLCKLKSLKALHIGSGDRIQNLPSTLENLTNLETLDVSKCGLTKFPEVLCKLKLLKVLHIGSGDRIQNLPNTLENLTNLEILYVFECGLIEVPQTLCKLKSLRILNIYGNTMIQNLPKALESLTKVKILDISQCGITEFNQIFCNLPLLEDLNLSSNPLKEIPLFESIFEIDWLRKLDLSNTFITRLPQNIEICTSLEELNISDTKIKELPTVIFTMKQLLRVKARRVPIQVLNEDFVKLWLQRPDILTKGQFQRIILIDDFVELSKSRMYEKGRFQRLEALNTLHFVKPPNEIVRRGPDACMKYYRALTADNAVNCCMLNVTVMGKTGAGKSSLIHSIKEGSSVLIHPSDRTVVVDTLEVKQEDVLLKIADFGGHGIYEMTCPLFLKSTKQVAIIAIKLSEYTESNHDELVTKWLTTAVSHMKSGSICIVATQCDLCAEGEVEKKMTILKEKAQNWIEEESSFWKKLISRQPRTITEGILVDKKFCYFQTSSMTMQGLKRLEEFLLAEATSNRSVLPKRWIDVYKKINEETDRGTHFITHNQYQTMFKESIPSSNSGGLSNRNINPVETSETEESLQCLQFLHDSGMILWYGEKHENLRNIIFHDPSFLLSVLQCLFRHDLTEVLEYDHDHFGRYFISKSKFRDEVRRFTQTGILNPLLLKCIWNELKLNQEIFDTMIEMLTMLDLCYIDGQDLDSMLRLPWFVREEDMGFLKDLWPKKLPPNTLQYTLIYCFCHRIPGVIYERFCVRLQRYLQTGAYFRQDGNDAVYIEQNAVKIFVERRWNKCEPCIYIHVRCSIEDLYRLQRLCLALHQDMDNLCNEYSGLYIDCYFLCPHCLLAGSTNPTERPTSDIVLEHKGLESVPCDPFTPGSIQIPAALIFLRLFGKSVYSKCLDFRVGFTRLLDNFIYLFNK